MTDADDAPDGEPPPWESTPDGEDGPAAEEGTSGHGGRDGESAGDRGGSAGDWVSAGDDPGDARDSDGPTGRTASARQDEAGRAPLEEVAAAVDERRGAESEPPEEGMFAEEEVTEIDTDVVWQRLDGEDATVDVTEGEREVTVVETGSYCQRCPYFTAPPAVSCRHDGTEILEFVDMDHVRVVDCPKVREARRLERL